MCQSELIHLAADLSFWHTDYLWKMPGSWSGYPYYARPDFYEDIARIASRGVMDLLFFGDLDREVIRVYLEEDVSLGNALAGRKQDPTYNTVDLRDDLDP